MVVYPDQQDSNSPRTYDEVGMYRPPGSKDDRNKAWQEQSSTPQQAEIKKQNLRGVPGETGVGGLSEKDASRGVADTSFNKPLMTVAGLSGGVAVAYMVMKAMRK